MNRTERAIIAVITAALVIVTTAIALYAFGVISVTSLFVVFAVLIAALALSVLLA